MRGRFTNTTGKLRAEQAAAQEKALARAKAFFEEPMPEKPRNEVADEDPPKEK